MGRRPLAAAGKSLVGASKKTLAAAGKRLSRERLRLRGDLTQLREVEHLMNEEQKLERAMMEIVAELERNPQKILVCRDYVMSDMLLDDDGEEGDLHYTLAFLHRVPALLLKQCMDLNGWRPHAAQLKELKLATEKNISTKVFHFGCMTHGSSRIPTHNKKEFKDFFVQRYDELNRPLDSDEWQKATTVDWGEVGFYYFKEDENTLIKGRYSHICLRTPEEIEWELPSHVHVAKNWPKTELWNFWGAKVSSPKGVVPRVVWTLKDLFKGCAEFAAIVEKFTIPADVDGEKRDEQQVMSSKGAGSADVSCQRPAAGKVGASPPPKNAEVPDWESANIQKKLAKMRAGHNAK